MPRLRFTIWRMMVAVAAAAIIFGLAAWATRTNLSYSEMAIAILFVWGPMLIAPLPFLLPRKVVLVLLSLFTIPPFLGCLYAGLYLWWDFRDLLILVITLVWLWVWLAVGCVTLWSQMKLPE
jgi:hypothetical protein